LSKSIAKLLQAVLFARINWYIDQSKFFAWNTFFDFDGLAFGTSAFVCNAYRFSDANFASHVDKSKFLASLYARSWSWLAAWLWGNDWCAAAVLCTGKHRATKCDTQNRWEDEFKHRISLWFWFVKWSPRWF